jgi:hypothetical protein
MEQQQKEGTDFVSEFHKRSGQSHTEARKLLTGMSVGAIGILYATLTGNNATTLDAMNKLLVLVTVVAMALSTGFGLAAWRADAAWAYKAAKNYKPEQIKPDGGPWHDVKKFCDRVQFALFAYGLLLAAIVTIRLIFKNG